MEPPRETDVSINLVIEPKNFGKLDVAVVNQGISEIKNKRDAYHKWTPADPTKLASMQQKMEMLEQLKQLEQFKPEYPRLNE